MSILKPPSLVERITGNVATESALTALAASVANTGGPLVPLLPVLAKSLASERQKKRVEEALAEVSAILEAHEAQICNLTDEQYKIINEAVLALLHTTHGEKLAYLRAVVKNALDLDTVQPQEAVVLSRIIRDLTAEEAKFVCENFKFNRVWVVDRRIGEAVDPTIKYVDPNSDEALTVAGLSALGLLSPSDAMWDATDKLRFTRITAKLIVLLRRHQPQD